MQLGGKDLWSKSMHWHFDGALRQIWEFHILFLFSPGTLTKPHHWRKTTSTNPSGEKGLFISTASETKHDTINIHLVGFT